MNAIRFGALVVAAFHNFASAQAVTIPTVPVGNLRNPPDRRYVPSGVGSVSYPYRIGKFEVTNAQYVEFLNSVDPTGVNTLEIYNSLMSSGDIAVGGINYRGGAPNGSKYEIKPGRDNNPVVYVSWYDAIRFANWLHNGRGNGDTESGAYTLVGGTPIPTNSDSIVRNPSAKWWIPSDDEWYKAAYHKNDGVTGNYWDYPTSTNTVPYSDQPPGSDAPDPSNTANFFRDDRRPNGYDDGFAVNGSVGYGESENLLTDVGAYTSSVNPYGTFDQGGNVWEWTETFLFSSFPIDRGGSWADFFSADGLRASRRGSEFPTRELFSIGFRVATIPEPTTTCLGVLAVIGTWCSIRRRS
jgi:formylglycine-generating enzyme required for sulfatase activity